MNQSIKTMCTHSGIFGAILVGIGFFGVTGWFPPVDPSLGADEIKEIYDVDRTAIRIGMAIFALGGVFLLPLYAAVSGVMSRIEADPDPILSRIQMAGGICAVMIILICAYLVLAAAYRPDMSASSILLFNDLVWMFIVVAYPPLLMQALPVAACILNDKSEQPLYPRWLGFANLWISLLYLPASLAPFVYQGPFAWNGLIAFYVPVFCFFMWLVCMWWYTLRAIQCFDVEK